MDLHGRLAAIRSRFVSVGGDRFTIDTRSLAAFRTALGLLVLADLLRRARTFDAFYTDAGVLPRSVLISRV